MTRLWIHIHFKWWNAGITMLIYGLSIPPISSSLVKFHKIHKIILWQFCSKIKYTNRLNKLKSRDLETMSHNVWFLLIISMIDLTIHYLNINIEIRSQMNQDLKFSNEIGPSCLPIKASTADFWMISCSFS